MTNPTPTDDTTGNGEQREHRDRVPPQRPPPVEAIANVYELKTQPEIVRYYNAAAGFPTKPTWLKAIKNNHYAS